MRIPAKDGYPEMKVFEVRMENGKKGYAIVPSEPVRTKKPRIVLFQEHYWWLLFIISWVLLVIGILILIG